MKNVKLEIEGMHCDGCVSRVESALDSVRGVGKVEVSLDREEAALVVEEGVSEEDLLRAVKETGYGVTRA